MTQKPPEFLTDLNATAPHYGRVSFEGQRPFGPSMHLQVYRLSNGLRVFLCEDHAAPVIAYHTWFDVGSRHEEPGKTGLAHLFEHLMFNETESHPLGEFDRLLEEAGAESNASTWLDFTQYSVNIPADSLDLVIDLETDRMHNLVLRDPQVASEKEVVMNERRFRVDDDVEGKMSEQLWALAFQRHSYRWPTIGWMSDIEAFCTSDCQKFYQTYYAPNNAALVLVGDFDTAAVLQKVSAAYGRLPPANISEPSQAAEPLQGGERRKELFEPTPTHKLIIGYRCPRFAEPDHATLTLLNEILLGGRASRLYKRLVRQDEVASEVRGFVGPHRDPGLWEIYAGAREEHAATQLLKTIDEELARLETEPVTTEEIGRAQARLELSLLASLETADGKASTIGFYQTVLGNPSAAFERLAFTNQLGPAEVSAAAKRYLKRDQRSVILVQPKPAVGVQ